MSGTQSFCCLNFSPPISKEQVVDKAKDEAADLALEVAASLALEIAAKAFCRIAISAVLMPLSFIPFVSTYFLVHIKSLSIISVSALPFSFLYTNPLS